MSVAQIFGVLSSFMMLCSRTHYFNSLFRGKAKPHTFSWFIWAIISSIGFAAQVAEGAGPGSWARGFSSLTCFILVIVSLLKGEKNVKKSDWITLFFALAAIPLWIATKTPVWSVILVCVIDTVGYFPTIRKSWNKPYEEPALSYVFSGMCAFFSLLAIEHYTLSTWLYSAVLTFTNATMASILFYRRKQAHK
ncbi:MAG TPA: hypothetical protein VHK86_04560 [Nitrososphaera sp.]|jgi:hypothetical protein|nr:hypothetical protein [Nitrososphaera sp.]